MHVSYRQLIQFQCSKSGCKKRDIGDIFTNSLQTVRRYYQPVLKGVDKSFAIQAGREIRIMVVPEQVSDADMVLLAERYCETD